jgi:hypothetical protein
MKFHRLQCRTSPHLLAIAICLAANSFAAADYPSQIKPFLTKYCFECHGGKKVKGKVNFVKVKTTADVMAKFETWEEAVDLLKHNEMPPEKQAQPTQAERAVFYKWYQKTFIDSLKARPGVFKPRRLSAVEFERTLSSLLGFKLEVDIAEAQQTVTDKSLIKKLFPPDPPGPSGFTKDTHNTPLSTAMWTLYALVIDGGVRELFHPKRRDQLAVYTGPIAGKLTPAHAKRLLQTFVSRAHRRPVKPAYLARAVANVKKAPDLEIALRFELKAALMSPRFLYRGILAPVEPGQHPVDGHELAERLSYFLWADMPDRALTQAAAAGGLAKPSGIAQQVNRMLQDPKARSLAEVFAVEWLTLNEIEHVGGNNPVFKQGIEQQPIQFMNYLFTENRSILELIDSRVTFANPSMRGYYDKGDHGRIKKVRIGRGIEKAYIPIQKVTLVKTQTRGGLLTMPGVLMMNKGPVIRGTWMLERILGDHLPEPPAGIKPVQPNSGGKKLTFRERFAAHRSNKTCAVCHNKIDPLGFALDGYDNNGRLIAARKGQAPINTSGKLPSGETFKDFMGLRKILTTTRRRVVIRNVVQRMLAYALGRKLTVYDRPIVEQMTKKLDKTNGGYGDLIQMIATSLPMTHTIAEKRP